MTCEVVPGESVIKITSELPGSVYAPMGVRTRSGVSTETQAGAVTGAPVPGSTATPTQVCASSTTPTLAFCARTRSGVGLPALAICAQVGRPVVPPRKVSQQANVSARERVLSFETAMIWTDWVARLGSLGLVMRYTYGVRSDVTYRLPSVPRAVENGFTLVGNWPGARLVALRMICAPGSYVSR